MLESKVKVVNQLGLHARAAAQPALAAESEPPRPGVPALGLAQEPVEQEGRRGMRDPSHSSK